jgi:ribosome maturation factor RimP
VEIDHADGVWIEDCADLSRFIEARVSREEEDYELEVGSAGLGQPFKILRQYEIHVGKQVETQTKDGKKHRGTLLSVDKEGFELGEMQKVKEEGKKRPVNKEVTIRFAFDEVAYTKYLIKIK